MDNFPANRQKSSIFSEAEISMSESSQTKHSSRSLPPLSRVCGWKQRHKGDDDNPLQRLSQQLARAKTIDAMQASQQFRTLNTRSLLRKANEHDKYTPSTNEISQSDQQLAVSRTLCMQTEYDAYLANHSKQQQPKLFSQSLYQTQDWLHKDRGGPISRRYPGPANTSLLDRYRERQKTILAGNNLDTSMERVQRSLAYHNEMKETLKRMQ